MNSIGLMTRTGDSSVKIMPMSGSALNYNLEYGSLDMLDYDWNYPVYFVGFASSHFIVIYYSKIYNKPTYISTGKFDDDFMKDFIARLSK